MSEEKILHPEEITENPFPGEAEVALPATSSSGTGVVSPTTTKPKSMPTKRTAVELLSSALNTRSKKVLGNFELAGSGGFQIGKYENGVSGDVRLTPNGMTARDSAGNTTFSLDGTDGSAVFKGEVQAGSLISGIVRVGNNNVIIDGANQRIIINDGNNDRAILGLLEE